MFTRLLAEAESLRERLGLDILEALVYIDTHRHDYHDRPGLLEEFALFMRHGKEMFSPVE